MATPEGEQKNPPVPKGDEYWKNYSELAKRKRVMPRLDGRLAYDVIKTVREIESRLLMFPGFVGIGPRGSRWDGYALPTSDYDIVVLIDSSAPNYNPAVMKAAAYDIRDSWAPEQGIRIHFDFEDMARIVHDDDLTRVGVGHLQTLAALGGDVIGPKLKEYRKIAHDKLENLPTERREKLLSNVAALRLDQEDTRSTRIHERINGHALQTYSPARARAARTRLWERKIFKTFGIRDTSLPEKPKS
ncbi:MAG: hypothetical protein G01um10148_1067 [Parcubacteria group bacterium Gr01-1014_8]|nr:MAG: hypothetical protein G01um10148_1067 [Parcubacteria group bacterium Gr01-1014_8]